MKRQLKTLCFTALFMLVSAQADEVIDRSLDSDTLAYAQSLNTTAALVVNWYGNQIKDDRYVIKPLFSKTFKDNYSSAYPTLIAGIGLEKAELTTTEDGLQFRVSGQLQFDKNGEIYQQPFNDDFQFQGKTPIEIKKLNNKLSDDIIGITDGSQLNDKGYYQSRGFAYAWLAYLNGVGDTAAWISLADWQDSVDYQLTVGGFSTQGTLAPTLAKHRELLGGGRYLLREMTVNRPDKTDLNRGTMTLSVDFVGEEDGIPTLGNIEQVIEFQVDDNGNWKILKISEKHLLPNPQPWQKILC